MGDVYCTSALHNLCISLLYKVAHTTLCGSDVCATSATIVRCSLIALVKGGTNYPEGSLFSDCELESLEELIDIATNRSAWRAKVASPA